MAVSRIVLLVGAFLIILAGAIFWAKREVPITSVAVEVPIAQVAAEPVMESPPAVATEEVAEIDQIESLFALDGSKLPVVETVSYTTRVPWLVGRPAWIADYASHYETSRHFIARSLNRGPDYFSQKVSPGDRFNVFRSDKKIAFHLVVNLARCNLAFYCLDLTEQQRYLLKTYPVAVGKSDSSTESGFTTPIGKYALGDKVAIYKPGTVGFFQDQKTEMIRIFGTRWMPFGAEIEGCTEPAKGFGLHGAPWIQDQTTGQFVEDLSKIGHQATDGCIHLAAKDIEEIFAIVLTKPTTVEIVKEAL